MKIKKLIKELSELDPELEVWISIDAEGNGFDKVEDILPAKINKYGEPNFKSKKPNVVVFWP